MTQKVQYNLELLESRDSIGRFMVEGVLDFDSVVFLNQRAISLFRDYKKIIIDLSGVTYVNSAGLALLLEWKRQAIINKISIELSGIPQKLLNIASMSEIEKILSVQTGE